MDINDIKVRMKIAFIVVIGYSISEISLSFYAIYFLNDNILTQFMCINIVISVISLSIYLIYLRILYKRLKDNENQPPKSLLIITVISFIVVFFLQNLLDMFRAFNIYMESFTQLFFLRKFRRDLGIFMLIGLIFLTKPKKSEPSVDDEIDNNVQNEVKTEGIDEKVKRFYKKYNKSNE